MDKKKSAYTYKVSIYDANGSLEKRWFVYYIDPTTNPPKRVRVYGSINKNQNIAGRKAEAEKLRNEVERKLNYFVASSIRTILLNALAEHVKRLRKKTRQSYASKIKYFILYLEANNIESVSDITPAVAAQFMKHLQETRNISASTYNAYIVVCAAILAETMPEEARSPFAKIKKQKESPTPALNFQTSDIRRIKKAMIVQDPILWLYCQFIYYCFIRPGELRLIKVADILLSDARIVVRKEVSKNGKEQYVNIPAAFLPDVEEYLELHDAPGAFYLFGNEGKPSPKPYGARRMSSNHQRLLEKIGLDITRHKLYSWKHTGAIALARASVPMKQIQIHLRHHSLEITDRYLRDMAINETDEIVKNYPPI